MIEDMAMILTVTLSTSIDMGTGSFDPCDLESLLRKVTIQKYDS
jgi:hypothetical protein